MEFIFKGFKWYLLLLFWMVGAVVGANAIVMAHGDFHWARTIRWSEENSHRSLDRVAWVIWMAMHLYVCSERTEMCEILFDCWQIFETQTVKASRIIASTNIIRFLGGFFFDWRIVWLGVYFMFDYADIFHMRYYSYRCNLIWMVEENSI